MLKNKVEVNMKKLTISVRVHIELEKIADLLGSASRGSSYWCENDLGFESAIKEVLSEEGVGSSIKDFETDSENNNIHILDLKKVKRGLTAMAKKEPQHFTDFIREDFDQTTGDVFLQCCLFGKVIYS